MERKNISIDEEVSNHIRNNELIPDFSAWVSEKYRNEFMNVEFKKKKLEELLDKVKYLKDDIKSSKQNNFYLLNKKESNWIKYEAIKRFSSKNFEGLFSYFKNEFGREELTKKQFKNILNKEKKK